MTIREKTILTNHALSHHATQETVIDVNDIDIDIDGDRRREQPAAARLEGDDVARWTGRRCSICRIRFRLLQLTGLFGLFECFRCTITIQ